MKTQCRKCRTGYMVRRARYADGHTFYGCTNYPTCTSTLSVYSHDHQAIGDYDYDGTIDAYKILLGAPHD